MALIEVGKKAPAFVLADQNAKRHALKDYAGRIVVLFFYPKDDTSGCTAQACGFEADLQTVDAAGAMVIGISPDGQASHVAFRNKYGLAFPLLVDADHAVAAAYGAWGEKSMYGRKYMGVERSTFLIDAKGVLRREWRKVKVPGHAEEVLAAAAEL